jgi:hypothetical protein
LLLLLLLLGLEDKERGHCTESFQVVPVRPSGTAKLETGKALATKTVTCWEVDGWSEQQTEEGKHTG